MGTTYDSEPCACGHRKSRGAVRCRKCTDEVQVGEAHPSWRGGRVVIDGYVRLMVKDHPRADKRGYVPEHTLVLEAALGRYLRPGETAHHRNGQRADNRPENLELWTTAQPSGVRVVDLLEWAHDLIAQYEPDLPVIVPASDVA